MFDIHRILCPIDFSETSHDALEHALAIARWYESEIIALHVSQTAVVTTTTVLTMRTGLPSLSEPEDRGRAEEQLRAWIEPRRPDVPTRTIVAEGAVAATILDTAKSAGADLIVMGTHGLTGFERFILGSVTEKVLRKATCPVLTVPPTSYSTVKLPYTRVLCPVDFSDSSNAALRLAFSLAKESDAAVTILHVVDTADSELLMQRFDSSQYQQAVGEKVSRQLEALVPDEVRLWCRPSVQVAFGKPYREILRVAASEPADLIVIGVRGRNPLDLAVFGSTTNQIVRRATSPVLTLAQ
jgi:nucleotide-binding universal stress UspA family protein